MATDKMDRQRRQTDRDAARQARQRGFTLIELLVVVAIVGILAGIAAAQYRDAPRRAREAVLMTNLATIRDVIDQYYADKGQYPSSLEDLVDSGYMRRIPSDPLDNGSTDWELIESDVNDSNPDQATGVFDVRSRAAGQALDGSYYADW